MSAIVSPLSSTPPVQLTLSERGVVPSGGAFAEALRKVQQASNAVLTHSIQTIDKVGPAAPASSLRLFSGMIAEIEKEGARVDRLIRAATSGKSISNVELLSLQASMYKYNLQIELLSKVVQQLVSSLKDLLKLQV